MMESILDCAIHVHFAMNKIYDEVHYKIVVFMLSLSWKVFMMEPILYYAIHVHLPWMEFMMEPIVDYAIYENFAMDEIYDGAS